jgi:undecaprenyl phosphate-alpha-L-ara4N flippase subunit ArnE
MKGDPSMDLAWVWLVSVVLLGVVGQLALKHALHRPAGRTGFGVLLSPGMVVWFVSYAASTILWLVVLRSVPLSQAFPILGAQFALIPVAARMFLGEEVATVQWIGIAVIAAGVGLVGQS